MCVYPFQNKFSAQKITDVNLYLQVRFYKFQDSLKNICNKNNLVIASPFVLYSL